MRQVEAVICYLLLKVCIGANQRSIQVLLQRIMRNSLWSNLFQRNVYLTFNREDRSHVCGRCFFGVQVVDDEMPFVRLPRVAETVISATCYAAIRDVVDVNAPCSSGRHGCLAAYA